jgi:Ser/Thr protein kinase RdoA (MazF antagonist)
MKMSPILKLDERDEEKEIEFELAWLASLSIQERFDLMSKKSGELLALLEANGHRRPPEITKRA